MVDMVGDGCCFVEVDIVKEEDEFFVFLVCDEVLWMYDGCEDFGDVFEYDVVCFVIVEIVEGFEVVDVCDGEYVGLFVLFG